ncbi:MAG: iron chelate uptake ABC transporter family permease subunit, partial [Paracoccus sp. (in: a-proteobacteria)]|nr:iron chelate uptake ABC transporter family permease subunit [Paracoccus sp. (in: a-proteobacteria)]
MRRRFWAVCLAGLAVLMLAITLAVGIGSAPIPFGTVWSIILNRLGLTAFDPHWPMGRENIVWDLRLPRALLAAIVGAGLGIAGAVMQGVTRNPLADPHLLGVSAGAAFGANLAILLVGNVVGIFTVPLFAFSGALLATALVISVAGLTRSTGPTRLIL